MNPSQHKKVIISINDSQCNSTHMYMKGSVLSPCPMEIVELKNYVKKKSKSFTTIITQAICVQERIRINPSKL